jgi:hypothetical protein
MSSIKVKERKVFGINEFRGIDSDSKPIRVNPVRASYGQDFMIEGKSAKTRPAFQYDSDLPFSLAENEHFIDWYLYDGIIVFVTNKNFYFQISSVSVTYVGHYLWDSLGIHSFRDITLDFEGKRPIFQEEKDCLFIFGLGGIYVFARLKEPEGTLYKTVIYELSVKPSNPFGAGNYFYQQFEDLPKPYEPTLMLGNSVFEDANLLSKVSKYKLFAGNAQSQDGKTEYLLPTHFNSEKHGEFQSINFDVEFYKGKLSTGVFPVFLGVLSENFWSSDVATDYGTILNPSAKTEIKEPFYPIKEFEYTNTTPETVVSTLVGLDRATFFNLTVKMTGQNVFDYLLGYIAQESANLTDDKTMIFTLNIEYIKSVRDDTTNFLVSSAKETEAIDVYVQLKKYENIEVTQTNETVYQSEQIEENEETDPYPLFPTVETGDYDLAIDNKPVIDDTEPIYIENYTQETVKNLARTYIQENEATFTTDGILNLYMRLYYEKNIGGSPAGIHVEHPSTWILGGEDNVIEWNTPSTITDGNGVNDYPSFTPVSGSKIVELSMISRSGQYFDFYGSVLYNTIYAGILNFLNNDDDGTPELDASGYAYAKIKIQTYWRDYGGTFYEKGISIVVPFFYIKAVEPETVEVRQSFVYRASIKTTGVLVDDNLYSFELSSDGTMIKFIAKDYFFDYRNEPAIDIKVTFAFNSDYELIAMTKFGINFGSENRLFLAGHPDYPNIDRYNVSNDLLGDNVKNQSYELAYFPSKNYRVVGDKGAINGYVVATDSVLYVTKESGSKLYIRQRTMDDNGIVGYNEHKTSIDKTPLNSRCIVRFNNDVLMLTKDGLYAVELSENILTDERLIKLRSGFVNKDLKSVIANATDAFIYEDKEYMYIFLDNTIYVADSRYLAQDDYGNIHYEIVKWVVPNVFKAVRNIDNELLFLETENNIFYRFEEKKYDHTVKLHLSEVVVHGATNTVFQASVAFDDYLASPSEHFFMFYGGAKVIGVSGTDYHIDGAAFIIDNDYAFRSLQDGDTVSLWNNGAGAFSLCVVSGLEDSERASFTIADIPEGTTLTTIYKTTYKVPLYITVIFEDFADPDIKYFRLSFYRPDEVVVLSPEIDEIEEDYDARVEAEFVDNDDYFGFTGGIQDVLAVKETPVKFLWFSLISDFGSNLMEKTMFRTNIYATRKESSNIIYFGYKTMRRLKSIEETEDLYVSNVVNVDLSNAINLSEVDFNIFTLSSFNDIGMSFPTKENNFLYIQFMIQGVGQIELNAIEIIYKLNRALKSIG